MMRRGGGLLLAWLAASAARGIDWVAVDISPSPDTLIAFDSDAPGASDPNAPIAALAGDFVRGLDLTGPLDGWYVCTAPGGGSPTGLFRLTAGESLRVGDLPFESTSTGGLTLNRSGASLYVVLDPPDSRSDTLFRVTFDGVWKEVGPVSLPGDADPTVSGLACDPVSGALYALENDADALLQIDPATGSATIVGGGLGVTVSGTGGMDFETAPPHRLLIATNGGGVYAVDPGTGGAGPPLGGLPFGTSAIAAVPAPSPCEPCDANCDGSVNGGDIQPFLDVLASGLGHCSPCSADTDGNGSVNGQDIEGFLSCLRG